MNETPACASCRFGHQAHQGEYIGCRRFPPKAAPFDRYVGGAQTQPFERYAGVQMHPDDWCGEFAPRLALVAAALAEDLPQIPNAKPADLLEVSPAGVSEIKRIAERFHKAAAALFKAAQYLKDDSRGFRARETYQAGLDAQRDAEELLHG